MTKLSKVLSYEQPTKYLVKTEDYSPEFNIPVLTANKAFVLGYTNEQDNILSGFNSPFILFDDFTCDFKYVDFDCKIKSSATKILRKIDSKDSLRFLFYAMKSISFVPWAHQRHWISIYSNTNINYYPYVIQNKIVDELSVIEKNIVRTNAKISELDELVKSQFNEMFGDPLVNPMSHNTVSLGELFDLNAGGTPSKNKFEYWDGGDISWIGSNLCQNVILYENDGKFITKLGLENSSARIFKVDTVLVALVGATIGKTALLKFETTTNQNVLGIQNIEKAQFNPTFVFYYMQFLYHKFLNIGDGGFAMATKAFVSNLKIYNINKKTQDEFALFEEQVDKLKFNLKKQINDLNELLESRMNFFFGNN